MFRDSLNRRKRTWADLGLLLLWSPHTGVAQGPSPETAPPLFPGGGLVSFGSTLKTRSANRRLLQDEIPLTARPTFSYEGDLNFIWGFYRDFDLAIVLPVATNNFSSPDATGVGGTKIGDAALLIKYRFYRRDSSRGTTQASLTLGPKLPTGSTDLTGRGGRSLPAALQPGSGSTDLFIGANWTYTGLFNIKRLVADEDFHALARSEGTQATRLGSDLTSRFWLSYRPYESKDGAREWFIGPTFTWLHSVSDRIAGVTESDSGGDVFLAGITTYMGVRSGMHIWLALDWAAAHSNGSQFMPVRRQISFGITQQFRMPSFR